MDTGEDQKKSERDNGIIQKKDSKGRLVWYARIVRTTGDGKARQFTRKAESKSHARRLRDELSDNFRTQGESSIEGSKLIFRELAAEYKSRKIIPAQYNNGRKTGGLRSHQSVNNFLTQLLVHFGGRRIKEITLSEVERYKQSRLDEPVRIRKRIKKGQYTIVERPRSIAGVNRELALLRAILNYAVSNGWLLRSPFLHAKGLVSLADETRRERVLTVEEELRLLDACSETTILKYERNGKQISARQSRSRAHLKPILLTALDTAMRCGELLKLRWEDLNFHDRTIRILAFNTKTARERFVGMTDRVFEALVDLRTRSGGGKEELVFGIKETVSRSFVSACKAAGIEGFRFHDCRHTAITRMIQAGLSPMEVMKVSGHTQMSTFIRYVNPDTQAVARIANVLSSHNVRQSMELEPEQESLVN